MILADIGERNCLEVILKRALRWLEGACHWINKTAARWWAEALWFVSALLLSGMVVSYWKTGKVYGGQWWEAMTAFGTVGSVIAAIAIPFWQYAKQLKELRLTQLHTNWALAEETHRLSGRLCFLGRVFQDCSGALPQTELNHLHAQLETAKQTTSDRFGRLLVDELLHHVTALRSLAAQRDNAHERARRDGLAIHLGRRGGEEARFIFERIEELHQQTYNWMSMVLKGFRDLGVDAPGAVYGEGAASVRMHASGDGSVSRS